MCCIDITPSTYDVDNPILYDQEIRSYMNDQYHLELHKLQEQFIIAKQQLYEIYNRTPRQLTGRDMLHMYTQKKRKESPIRYTRVSNKRVITPFIDTGYIPIELITEEL